MTARKAQPAVSTDVRREIMASLGQSIFREFNIAFTLMSLIPLFIGTYVLAARLFTINIFEGLTGFYFFLAIVFALLGFLVGRRILQAVLARLIDANVQLRQYELMKSGFVANVAYELRPPLAAVQMSLKNLADGLIGPLAPAQQQSIAECHQVVGRLTRLTTDLIDITDAGKGKPQLQLKVLGVEELIREAIRTNEPYLNAHRLTVAVKLPPQPVLVFGDRDKLLQAFHSLIDHAVRWSADGREIAIEVMFLPQEFRVVITHGVAITTSDFARALDAYSRLGGATEHYLGLGLHLARDIIEQHHGRFWLEGEPGQPSHLVVSLPILEPAGSISSPPPVDS